VYWINEVAIVLEGEASHGKIKNNSFFTKGDPKKRGNAGGPKRHLIKPTDPGTASGDC
jgi:hypothetical protein